MGFERALLQRFRDGETEALGEVYRLHAGPLTRMLRAAAFRGQSFASLRSAVELENAIVEVFTRAFEPRARQVYDGQRPYEHFLMGIARNYLLELARNREHPAGIEVSDELDAVLSLEQPDVHEALEDREVNELMRRFRAELGEEEGQLFDLRYVEGLTQNAAADRLGQTRIQLRRREHKLRLRVLEFLKTHGYLGAVTANGWSFISEGA
ncbi:MAG: sigma-70 family RNA polymerase sigma factor [Archangium sp.]|nr:sigma-70 family RNA polymerase sigma factor [Archangium sp.]